MYSMRRAETGGEKISVQSKWQNDEFVLDKRWSMIYDFNVVRIS